MTTVMPGDKAGNKAGKGLSTDSKVTNPQFRKATASARAWKKYGDKPKVVYTRGIVTQVAPAPAPMSKACVAVQNLAATPTSYVNPERLMDDIANIYAARDRVFLALDQLDCAARFAGTPIRSTSAREHFHHLIGVIREAEAHARTAWQSELAAAGRMTPQLTRLVVAAGVGDARTIDSLLAKDGDELSANEYEELMVVLDGALIDSADKVGLGAEDYAASFFAGVDKSKLQRLIATLALWTSPSYRDTDKGKRAQGVLSEVRSLFERAVEHDDVFTKYPAFATKLESLDVKTLNVLLLTDDQTVRRDRQSLFSDPGAGALIGISASCLARLAKQILVDPLSMHPKFFDPGSDGTPSARMTILRLLEADTGRGGDALAQYLAPSNTSLPAMEAASKVLLALIAPNSQPHRPLTATSSEEVLSAKIMKSFFVQSFDHGTPDQVRAAAEVLELTIANTDKLGPASHPMLAALATGFAGTMIHQLTVGELLTAARNFDGSKAGSPFDAGSRGLDPNQGDLGRFIAALCAEPAAVRTIAAALGPMVRTFATAENSAPRSPALMEGAGFILGSILKKFDHDAGGRRSLLDGISAWLTAGFATVGALAGGPVSSMAAGALGSGLLQTIASLVEAEPSNGAGLPTDELAMRNYFRTLYAVASFRWLQPNTQLKILSEIENQSYSGVKPQVAIVSGVLTITNVHQMTPEDVQRVFGRIGRATSGGLGAVESDDQAITDFVRNGTGTTQATRQSK